MQPQIPNSTPATSMLPQTSRYQIKLCTTTGLLAFWIFNRRMFVGTYDECAAEYKKAQKHNLLFGWWSLPNIIFVNWWYLYENRKSLSKLKQLANISTAA
ncbi:MAG: hypothetical protein ACREGG_03160 [Candidatus Saccharimonadales bacterium]